MEYFTMVNMSKFLRIIVNNYYKYSASLMLYISNYLLQINSYEYIFKTNFEKVKLFNDIAQVEKLDNITSNKIDDKKELVLQMFALISEEVNELKDAIDTNDTVEIRDALADILYVTYGMGYRLGISMDEDFDIVHSSNMSKFCKTEAEANQTVEHYANNYKYGAGLYDTPYYEKLDSVNMWVIRNRSSGKILKSINYTPVKWK
jgi:NTP pyrophosphatase (non-canonical NTP hydrolase)